MSKTSRLWLTFLVVLSCKTSGVATQGSDIAAAGADLAMVSDCKVVIIGSGVSGLHTAYRLAPQYGSKIC